MENATPQLTISDSSSSYHWQPAQQNPVHLVSQHSEPQVLHAETAIPANQYKSLARLQAT